MSENNQLVRQLAEPLYNAKFWMKLMGVFMIIIGALYALTIVGIIVAWLPIWIGVLLFQAAGALERAYSTGNESDAIEGFGKLKTYFVINGVLLLISLAFVVIGILMGGAAALMSLGGMGGM